MKSKVSRVSAVTTIRRDVSPAQRRHYNNDMSGIDAKKDQLLSSLQAAHAEFQLTQSKQFLLETQAGHIHAFFIRKLGFDSLIKTFS